MAHVEEDFEVLRAYVGAPNSDDDYVDSCYHEAEALVDKFIGEASVPSEIRLRALLVTGSELYHARSAPNGIYQGASFDGSPIRIARDPMTPAYPILRQWVGGGFA